VFAAIGMFYALEEVISPGLAIGNISVCNGSNSADNCNECSAD